MQNNHKQLMIACFCSKKKINAPTCKRGTLPLHIETTIKVPSGTVVVTHLFVKKY